MMRYFNSVAKVRTCTMYELGFWKVAVTITRDEAPNASFKLCGSDIGVLVRIEGNLEVYRGKEG